MTDEITRTPDVEETNSMLFQIRDTLIFTAVVGLLINLDQTLIKIETWRLLKNYVPPMSIILAIIAQFAATHPPSRKT